MHWVEREAERIAQQDKDRALQHEYELLAARALDAKIPALWSDLKTVIEEAVKVFNATFPHDVTHQINYAGFLSHTPNGLALRKTYYPAVTVEAVLDKEARRINITVTERHSSGGQAIEGSEPALEVSYEEGDIYIKHGRSPLTLDDAAAHILRPILNSF